MLNSHQLSELKIEGLAHLEINNERLKTFFQISSIPSLHKFDHFILSDHSNANIIAFVLILLSHIFEDRKQRSLPSSSKDSPNSELNSGGASVNPEKNSRNETFRGRKQEQVNGEEKLEKIYEYLFNPSIDFLQIKNIPQNFVQILQKMFLTKQTSGRYMKKLVFQFLQILQTQTNFAADGNHTEKKCQKESILVSQLQKYPVIETLLSLFVRSILVQFYQIYEASDFERNISDFVVYNALCDAFQYNNSLHFEESSIQITSGFYIRFINLKKLNGHYSSQYKYRLVSLPQVCSLENNIQPGPGEQGNSKKVNEVFSTQSLSFRVSGHKIAQRSDEGRITRIQEKKREKYSKNGVIQGQKQKIIKQSYSYKGKEIEQKKEQPLNGYTSMQILKQLTPEVRDSMMKNINCYRRFDK